jgi:protoporphyrin/coproporphyrin ferrochelatase
MSGKIGVLLINLGTPNSYQIKDVFRYLVEFLTDPRVIDLPWLKRQLLVRGLIVPKRYRQSAHQYRQIWQNDGSPLLIHSRFVEKELQQILGDHFKVVLSMRYQSPSIIDALVQFERSHLNQLIILPLFPQYASATTGSIYQKVMDEIKYWNYFPKINFINHFFDHPDYISAFCDRAKHYPIESFDHILFSFHGLPERQVKKADFQGNCLTNRCCEKKYDYCYKSQCHQTAGLIAQKLKLPTDRYSICFQSRLGKEPWISPDTEETILKRLEKGDKRLLVFCPSFVCDCLETIYEIGHEYASSFKEKGGEHLQLVEGLNSHPSWIEALHNIVLGSIH